MKNTVFYSLKELEDIGFNAIGENVLISRKASIYNAHNISFGNHVRIDDFSVLSGGKEITIGDYVHIGCFCGLYGGTGIAIGSFSTLSSRVALYSESDDFSGDSLANPTIPMEFKPGYIRGKINIHDHVIIGTNSTILPGVSIEDGAVIGAHSLVKDNCEAWTVNAGVPARMIKARRKNILSLMEDFSN